MSVLGYCFFFFFKQKTAYEMRISDWSSDVCSSDLGSAGMHSELAEGLARYTLVPKTIFAYRFSEGRGWLLEAWECTKEEVLEETKIGRASCRERVCKYV